MKKALIFLALFSATPVYAHHEVIVTTSLMPLAGGMATVVLAGLARWMQYRKTRMEKSVKRLAPRG